jgi:parallel beta-helix repeat protein
MKKKVIATCLMGIFLVSTLASANTTRVDYNELILNTNNNDEIQIEIWNNEDFENCIYVTEGDGTQNNPYIIKNLDVSFITIDDTTVYFIIKDCRVSYWIDLYQVSNGTLQNCIINEDMQDDDRYGISLNYECVYNTITGCKIYKTKRGISLWNGCSYNIISDCEISFGTGFRIYGYNNPNCYSEYNEISNCIIRHTSFDGIKLVGADNNIVKDCIIYDCGQDGIYLESSENNKIYYNNFYQNQQKNARVIYPSLEYYPNVNDWDDDVSIGNYWDDYNGIDGYPIYLLPPINMDRYPQKTPFINLPPSMPEKTFGNTEFSRKTKQIYRFKSNDLNGDQIKYYIDWGDGKTEETDYYDSGKIVTFEHTWEKKGNYIIKISSTDDKGNTDFPSEFDVNVHMSRQKTRNPDDDENIKAFAIVIGRISNFWEDEEEYSFYSANVAYYWWSSNDGFHTGHVFNKDQVFEKPYYSLRGIVKMNFICAIMSYNGPEL